jgi:hypothetical protein
MTHIISSSRVLVLLSRTAMRMEGGWLSMLYESKAVLSRDDKLLADRWQATAIQHGDTPL